MIKKRDTAIYDILDERERQDRLKAEGRFDYTCTDLAVVNPDRCMTILVEEVGEVARALQEWGEEWGEAEERRTRAQLRTELIQVAAVALAWVEGLDQ